LSLGSLLKQSIGLYRSNFLLFLGIFAFPALGHLCWIIAQRGLNHLRHPDWPQQAIVIRADWGLSIYSVNLVLTCLGACAYYVLAGLSLAAATGAVFKQSRPEPALIRGDFPGKRPHWFRFQSLQFVSAVRVWGILVAMMGTIVFGADVLDRFAAGMTIWYGIVGLTLVAAVPFGLWMHVRFAMAVPVSFIENLPIGAALDRSVQLTKGRRARIFAVVALVGGLRWILGIAGSLLAHAHIRSGPMAAVGSPLLSFVLDALIGPVYGIAMVLLYRDIRDQSPGSH
jgi:hypothetical protein